MKALVTGSEGFVGHYLKDELKNSGYSVTGVDIKPGPECLAVDLTDAKAVEETIAAVQPDILIHLAGQASVARSWEIPQATFTINVICAVNLMEAVRRHAPECRMVLVGSSDQYGTLGALGADVRETLDTHPQTPYAVSKKAQEEIAQVYARAYHLNVCMTRSFNHGGAGQREGFLIPDFSAGIVRVEKGIAKSLRVGNLSAQRDFTHVKDIVRAYRLLAEKGRAGEVYNVGSGTAHSAQEILDRLIALSGREIPVEQDPAKLRPSDTPLIVCNHDKLTQDTGWQPEIPFDTVLKDTLEFYRAQIGGNA